MDTQVLLLVQIVADFVLCIAVIVLLTQLNRKQASPPPALSPLSEEAMREFKALLAESQQAANNFLESMEESRKKLREVVQLLDSKEKSCRDIIEQAGVVQDPPRNSLHEGTAPLPDEQFGRIIELSGQGLTEQEIARRTGLTEGEVVLVLDLHRSKENV